MQEILFFCRGHPVVFIKIKDNNIVPGFSQTQQYIYFLYFYVDDMLRSADLHQATFRKLRIRYMQYK